MVRARSLSRCLQRLAACAILVLPPPVAADPTRGQALFAQFCSSCHSPTPGNPIEAGAGNPAAIRFALTSVPAMQGIRPLLDATDIQDLADYLDVRFNGGPPAQPPAPPPAPPAPPPAPVTLATAVEYHHAALDHYFITADTAEIAALDAAIKIQGWLRTGQQFKVWATAAGLAGASPVCRYYIPPEDGNSHFYSASPSECEDTRVKFPRFEFEAPEVFAVALPDLVTGACPATTRPVYRLWNNRADANHRYTTSLVTRAAMIGSGFMSEGYGANGVVFCAPQ